MRPQLNLNALLHQKRNAAPPRPKPYKSPNIKSLFLAEPGWIVADTDLAQADARVVCWEADDKELMQMFLDPSVDLHTENAKTIFGTCPDKSHPNRKKAKAGVHAVNYNVGARTLAKTLGITVHEAEFFISRWFQAHPQIKKWHERIYDEMCNRRYIQNAFGSRKCFFGKTDGPTALSEALAWIPQSTVGNIINIAWMRMDRLREQEAYVSMQVHDSLVSQHNKDYAYETLAYLHQAMLVEVPYETPLIIPTSLEVSAENIGQLVAVDWDGCILDPNSGARTGDFWAHWPTKRLEFTKPEALSGNMAYLNVTL